MLRNNNIVLANCNSLYVSKTNHSQNCTVNDSYLNLNYILLNYELSLTLHMTIKIMH